MRNAVEPPESRKELHPNGHTHTNHASEHVCTSQEDTQSGSRLGRIAVIVAILVLLLVVIPVAVIVSGRSSSKDERTTPSAMDDVPLPVPTSPFVPSPSDPTSPTTIGSPPIPATLAPTQKPTAEPTHRPTHRPTMEAPPTISPQPTRSAQPSATPSQMPSTSAPSAMPSISLAPTTAVLENIRLALEPVVANPDALWDVSTPEAAALAWMARNEWVEPDRIEQRYALLTLDFATQGLERRPPVTSRRHGSRHLRALQQGAMTLTANEVLWEPLFSRNQLPDECQWFGVTCTNGIVTALIRPDLQLGGTIPQDIRLLRNLTNLDLGENQLRGTIPETLFQCTLLRELYLHDNLLTGTISNNFAQLTDLQKVFLSDNRFTGTFPDGFSSPARTLGRPLRTYHSVQETKRVDMGEKNVFEQKYSHSDSCLFSSVSPTDFGCINCAFIFL